MAVRTLPQPSDPYAALKRQKTVVRLTREDLDDHVGRLRTELKYVHSNRGGMAWFRTEQLHAKSGELHYRLMDARTQIENIEAHERYQQIAKARM